MDRRGRNQVSPKTPLLVQHPTIERDLKAPEPHAKECRFVPHIRQFNLGTCTGETRSKKCLALEMNRALYPWDPRDCGDVRYSLRGSCSGALIPGPSAKAAI